MKMRVTETENLTVASHSRDGPLKLYKWRLFQTVHHNEGSHTWSDSRSRPDS